MKKLLSVMLLALLLTGCGGEEPLLFVKEILMK